MRRRLLIVAIFLLAGAVVNVAVAWGCVWNTGTQYTDAALRWEQQSDWASVLVTRGIGPTSLTASAGSGIQLVTVEGYLVRQPSSAVVIQLCRAGWPLLALGGERISYLSPAGTVSAADFVAALSLHDITTVPSNAALILPLRLIWPGFAVNTLLYAAVLWLLICGPFTLRRFIRMKRGQCLKCGYPMGDSAVCSECGRRATTASQARNMTRRLLILVVAGAVVNVGVAWGCALWSPMLKTETIDEIPRWARHRAWGIGWSAISQPFPTGSSTTIEAGFPLACVGGEYIWTPSGGFGGNDTRFLIGWERGQRWPKPPRPFPIRPLWFGFAVDTLFYAAVLWLLICGPFALRRFIRDRRGLCPACAYPMGESPVCSECGKALPECVKVTT